MQTGAELDTESAHMSASTHLRGKRPSSAPGDKVRARVQLRPSNAVDLRTHSS